MKARRFILLVLLAVALLPSLAQNLCGTWHGALNVGGQKLGLIFHFYKDGSGKYSGKMDVPQQGAKGIPVDLKVFSCDSLCLQVPAINMSYSGKLEKEIIKGTFRQNGMAFPLNLTSGKAEQPVRPQDPQPPFGYKTEEVTFQNKEAGVMLAGTLTYPTGYVPGKGIPVVLMVSGSGAQNRNEEVFGHKPFLVLADYLAKHGIASLRYDDRGVGKSTGNAAACTSEDFAEDAKAGLDWLRGCKTFNRIGVLGHSEGGMIAFMLGAGNAADFIVSMAGTGIPGDTLLAEQRNAALRMHRQPAGQTVKLVRKEIASRPQSVWLDFFMDYNPAPAIAKTEIPVMAINGSNDMQVLAESNLGMIRKLLAGKNKKNLIKEYPDLNHLFQHCAPKNALDYYHIKETCSPEVLQDIAGWINGL